MKKVMLILMFSLFILPLAAGEMLQVNLPIGGAYGVSLLFFGFTDSAEVPVDSSADKSAVTLAYDGNRNIADNADDACFVYYRSIGDDRYRIGFTEGEGLRNEDGTVIDYVATIDGSSYSSSTGASSGMIDISGTAFGVLPVHIETESIAEMASSAPAGKYTGSLTLSVLVEE